MAAQVIKARVRSTRPPRAGSGLHTYATSRRCRNARSWLSVRPDRGFSGGAVSAAPEPESVILGDAERPCTTQWLAKVATPGTALRGELLGVRSARLGTRSLDDAIPLLAAVCS